MTEIRLHLGCGNVSLPGWTNIDSRYQPGVDRVDNIGILKRYEPDSVDEIYACHCLDHFSRWDYPRVLRRWHELLKPGGRLRLSTVDFNAIVEEYSNRYTQRPMSHSELVGALYAAQDYETNHRKVIWTWEMLSQQLEEIGFSDVRGYKSNLADCSTATLPSGRLLSLNAEALK